jgi:hypothetical protein
LINKETLDLYKNKVAKMSREELEDIAANALYHLQVMVGTRNSFAEAVLPERSEAVQNMQALAVKFTISNQV